MKITFPHMGNVYIAGKALLDELGRDVVIPPPCSKKTLELGTKYGPESICLPLKINIGNYIEAIEKGADTVFITGSCGPCRFGFYGMMEQEILKDLGYDVSVIVFDPPDGKPLEFIKRFMDAAGTRNIYKITKNIYKARNILKSADELTHLSNIKRAHVRRPYEVDRVMQSYHQHIEFVHGIRGVKALIDDTRREVEALELKKNNNPLKIGIIGEIYSVLEPFVNLEIEKKLGHLGVEAYNAHSPSKWIDHHLGLGQIGISEEHEKWRSAKPYLKYLVGGHGRETLGSAVKFAREGFDGIIQILPFNCMPEVVAESILPAIERDYNIPILTLIVDEMTGEAGYLTRIEAFIDLLKRRREERLDERVLLRR